MSPSESWDPRAVSRTDVSLRLVGFRLFGPAPITDVFIPWNPGLHVLYGLNGAGKSTILRGMEELLDGRGDGELIYRFVEVDSQDDWSPIEVHMATVLGVDVRRTEHPAVRAIVESLFRPDPALPFHLDESWLTAAGARRAAAIFIAAAMEKVCANFQSISAVPLPSPAEVEAVALEVARQGWLVITPVEGLWYASIGASLLGSGPLAEEFGRLADWQVDVEQDEPDFVEGSPQIVTPLRPAGPISASWLFPGADSTGFRLFRHFGDLSLPIPIETDVGVSISPNFIDFVVPPRAILTDDSLEESTQKWFALRSRVDDGALLESPRPHLSVTPAGETVTSDWLLEAATDATLTASDFIGAAVDNAPQLECVLAPPEEWFRHDPFLWVAVDKSSGSIVELSDLSEAQQRLADLAIRAATRNLWGPVANIFTMDEPDSGLHARAESSVARLLANLAALPNAMGIVATHSRAFLNSRDGRLLHVRRGASGDVLVDPMDRPTSAAADELGLERADVLQLCRGVLLVEGEHDKLVLETLIGHELADLSILVIPIRGARHAATAVDAQLLSTFTDARITLVLDNIAADKVRDVWAKAQDVFRSGGTDRAIDVVKAGIDRSISAELQFIHEYLIAALKSGEPQRFDCFGFSRRDIVEYLPVERIVPGGTSWEELHERFVAQIDTKKGLRSFKPWLAKAEGVEITEDLLLHAIAGVTETPPEFVALVDRLAWWP